MSGINISCDAMAAFFAVIPILGSSAGSNVCRPVGFIAANNPEEPVPNKRITFPSNVSLTDDHKAAIDSSRVVDI